MSFPSMSFNYPLREAIAQALPWVKSGTSPHDPKKSVKWIDGLRGIASFLVILTHLARAFDFGLFFPSNHPDQPPRILQYPILRIPWQGRIGVTIFAFLTGYVCALKPLKLSRAARPDEALSTVARSAFRRPPRLVLPATIALLISWTIAQLGGFTVANRSDCGWCRYAAPDLEDSFGKEIVRLGRNFLSTWTTGYMAYDDHQWALRPLLLGSFLVYLVLFATVYCGSRSRLVVYFGLMAYYHQNGAKDTETFQLQCIYGMLLSDLSHSPAFTAFCSRHPWPRRLLTAPLALLGLYIASFPGEHAEWVPWSNSMQQLSQYIFPPHVHVPKRYTALGLDMVIFSIFLSPRTKEVLSGRVLLWLGKQSFAVYLIHGTLLRVPLMWMLYGITGQPWEEKIGEDGNVVQPEWLHRRTGSGFWVCVLAWIGLVYVCASLWTRYVDPWCARVTEWLEGRVGEARGEKEYIPMAVVST